MTRGLVHPRDSINQQETWTFGQILPVLLLIAPIWSLVTVLISCLTNRASDNNFLPVKMEPIEWRGPAAQTSSTHAPTTYFTTPGESHSSSIRENQTDLATHCYISSYWIGPCLTFVCLIILALTSLQFYAVAVPSLPLEQLWINGCSDVYVVLFV